MTLSEQTIAVVNVNKPLERICCALPTEICLSGTVPIYKLCAWGDEKSCPDDHGKVYTYGDSASKELGVTRCAWGSCPWMGLWRRSASKQVHRITECSGLEGTSVGHLVQAGSPGPWSAPAPTPCCRPEQSSSPRGRRAPCKKLVAEGLFNVFMDRRLPLPHSWISSVPVGLASPLPHWLHSPLCTGQPPSRRPWLALPERAKPCISTSPL